MMLNFPLNFVLVQKNSIPNHKILKYIYIQAKTIFFGVYTHIDLKFEGLSDKMKKNLITH